MRNKRVVITGVAGFIGYHLCLKLINENFDVIGLDNINSYYSINLKKNRLKNLEKANLNKNSNFHFIKADISDKEQIDRVFEESKFDVVVNLAAQAGVRESLKMPDSYFKSNFIGFLNIISLSNNNKVKKFIFASSSSVYGDKKKFPLLENIKINPKNIYSASKKN